MSDVFRTVLARGTSRENPEPRVEVYIPDLEAPLTMTFIFTEEGVIVDAEGEDGIRTFSNTYDEFYEMMLR